MDETEFQAEDVVDEHGRATAGEPPFDAKRFILGCFEPIFLMGRV